MKINLQNISRVLIIAGSMMVGAVSIVFAQPRNIPPSKAAISNVVFKERSVQVQITPTDLDSRSGLVFVSRTGPIRLSGTLATASGCCVRLKATIHRIVIGSSAAAASAGSGITDGNSNTVMLSENSSNSSVFKEQTFELCGSQQINLTENIGAAQDDARFIVRIQNIDAWNKTNVGGNLTLRYPTANRILTGQPSIKFDLPQGLEANRAFTLSPNTPGKLKVKVSYTGTARVRVTLKKPNNSNAKPPVEGASGMELDYDISPADISNGATWIVNVLNLSDAVADDVDVSVIYTVDQ